MYCFTTDHDAIPCPLFMYEVASLKSVCTSINDVPRHSQHQGIPESGDIVNVDVSTIYKGCFCPSRMFMIGEVSPDMQRLVQVTKECRDMGIQTAQPWRLGDVGAAIQGACGRTDTAWYATSADMAAASRFHEEPDVEHFGKRGTGMLIVPGMTFTIEPMINMGTYDVFIDEADGWTVCTDDGLPSPNGKANPYYRRRKRDTDAIRRTLQNTYGDSITDYRDNHRNRSRLSGGRPQVCRTEGRNQRDKRRK